jgi:phytoene dehydrogenase-like protein
VPGRYDAIVIGAGLNGLTAAASLAGAGRRVLVLDARPTLGGATTTEELAPGFRIDPAAEAGWISPELRRELTLDRHGVELLPPEPCLASPQPDGPPLVVWRDEKRTVDAVGAFSKRDAARWPAFAARMSRLAGFLAWLYRRPPPRATRERLGDWLDLAMLGRKVRSLGRADMVDLLRILPMPIADLLGDTFESDLLRAAIGAGGVIGIGQGPRSGGTTFVLLHHHVGASPGGFRMRQRVRHGSGALAHAIAQAARARGAEIRQGARVAAIAVAGARATGVVLDDGEEIAAGAVLSSADARTTLVDLADPAALDPELVRALQQIRCRGVLARVHLALDCLPRFRGLAEETLHGVISIADSLDGIERASDAAKYGTTSTRPLLEVRVPSVADPSLAPPGRHVMSVSVQYAPYRLREGQWDAPRREALGDQVVRLLDDHAPGLAETVRGRLVVSPLDLEERYALPEGSVEHGELALDQVLFMRPVPSSARYRTPIEALYLCGAGAHPGRGVVGAAGRLAARAVLEDVKR